VKLTCTDHRIIEILGLRPSNRLPVSYYLQMSICANKNETWISKMTTIICNSCEQHFLQMIRCNGVYKTYNMLFRRDVIGSHDLACLVVKIAPFQLDLLWRVNFKLLQLSYITE
jgi:hypothetical protein